MSFSLQKQTLLREETSSGWLLPGLLFMHTTAEHIIILSYSAEGRVSFKVLLELYCTFAGWDDTVLKKKLRHGAVVFAATSGIRIFWHIPLTHRK